MSIITVILSIAYVLNIISVLSILFIDRRNISSTLCWLMIFIFVPLAGFVFYFFFGSTMKYKLMSKFYRLEKIDEAYYQILKKNMRYLDRDKIEFSDRRLRDYKDIIKLNAKNAESVYTQDNSAVLLTSAKQKFDSMFEDIENAKTSINVLYFIIKSEDEIGKKFIDLLTKKAKEGVEVRLIYDTMGYYKKTRRRHFAPLEQAGGMVYGFLPTVWKTMLNINYRMHRKIVVIDGKIAYTGGFNVGDDYFGLDKKVHPWRDTSVRLTGSSVQMLQLCFLSDWNYLELQTPKKKRYSVKIDDISNMVKYFPPVAPCGSSGVQILCDGPNKEYNLIKDSYIKMILSAKKYVYIQTPYLIPDETLINALKIAANSGVDVRIMIPGVPDKHYVYHASLSFVEELLKYGVKIYKYKGFIHAKTFVLDDLISSVGSANFDIRSFSINYEVNAMIYDSVFAENCRKVFENDIRKCEKLKLERYKKRGLIIKLRESFYRLFTPLM